MSKILSIDTPIAPATDAGRAGVLALANEDRFEAANYSEGLTEFVLGVLGTDLAPLVEELNFLAPPVMAPRRFEYKKEANALSFLADLDDERAIGARFRKLEQRGESVNAKTANRGLTYTIDKDEQLLPGYTEQVARWLTAILLRNAKRRAIAVIDAAATNTNVSFTASTDPDDLVETGLIAAHTARGIYPNRAIYGLTAWQYRKKAFKASTKDGRLIQALMSEQDVADALSLETLRKSMDVFKTSKSGSKSQLLSNLIYAFYADPVATRDDASNVKRFYTPCENGEMIRTYTVEHAKTIEVLVEHYSTEAVTDSTGVRKFTASNS